MLWAIYFIDDIKIFRNGQYYYEPQYGVAQETFFFENMECSEDPYAYNSCSKLGIDTCSNPSFASYLATSRKFTERQENNFAFANPSCRTTCR